MGLPIFDYGLEIFGGRLPATTLTGAIAGGDQTWTNVGDMTFAAGSVLASGSTNGNTLLMKANDTTFLTFTTGATDACELDGCILDTAVAKGTWTASGTWTIPAVTLGGTLNAGSQTINNINSLIGRTDSSLDIGSPRIGGAGNQAITFYTYNAAESGYVERLRFSGQSTTAVATWANITHTGLNITATLAVAGTQVIGARVIDARCDDVVDSTYGAEEAGVLDALRDAMITHGLIAAA